MQRLDNTITKDNIIWFVSNLLLLAAAVLAIVGWQPFTLGYWGEIALYYGLALLAVSLSLIVKTKRKRPEGRSFSSKVVGYIYEGPPGMVKRSRQYYNHKLLQLAVIALIAGLFAWYVASAINSLAPRY